MEYNLNPSNPEEMAAFDQMFFDLFTKQGKLSKAWESEPVEDVEKQNLKADSEINEVQSVNCNVAAEQTTQQAAESVDEFNNSKTVDEVTSTQKNNQIQQDDVDSFKFNTSSEITAEDILAEADRISQVSEEVKHTEIIPLLLEEITPVNFSEKIKKAKDRDPSKSELQILIVECILQTAIANDWQICKNNERIFIYNNKYWGSFQDEPFKYFLGCAAERMGVDKYLARYFTFKNHLFQQFMAAGFRPKPEPEKNKVLINLMNGTFEISSAGQKLRPHNPNDFLTYLLPFSYDKNATAPLFQSYLDKVLLDTSTQMVLAEFMGYVFVDPGELKLEKACLLKGGGANGKSVFFEIMYALFGTENVTTYSLQGLTDNKGNERAGIENKLINYASEISTKMGVAFFKQLVSGEPIPVKLLYKDPYIMSRYAKLMFNCNELPKDVEHTLAFFRRLLIIPFDVTIQPHEQDPGLAKKIIASELAGIFNWILQGLQRLLNQRAFTHSELIENQVEQYRRDSDNVRVFLDEEGYGISLTNLMSLHELYMIYSEYCKECGYRPCAKKTFVDRIHNIGYTKVRRSNGWMVYVTQPPEKTPFVKRIV